MLARLPPRLVEDIADAGIAQESIVEIVLDFGRKPLVRARSNDAGADQHLRRRGHDVTLSPVPVSREELDYIVDHCSEFAEDNRSGIDGTLHRISAIKNRAGHSVLLLGR